MTSYIPQHSINNKLDTKNVMIGQRIGLTACTITKINRPTIAAYLLDWHGGNGEDDRHK